jgi:beta-lactam-binding protein with PASTA domain
VLEEVGFKARIRRERSLHPDGLVFEQKPTPGKRVRRGWTVRVTVAFYTPPEPPPPPPAPPSSTMTRLVGLDYAEASSRMEELGVIANSYPVRSRRTVAVVIAQKPRPGTRVLRGSRIRLTVSAGTRPLSPGTVPDTVGLTELDAHLRCRDAHFMCRTVVVTEGPSGRVVRQLPEAGSTKRPLTQMTLYVGGG